MRYSTIFPKTLKMAPSGAESINHQLLARGGFIDQLMAGSWTLLPLGLRVVSKINQIIRQELNSTGAWEAQLPLLHPKEIWSRSGRWDDPAVAEIMYRLKDRSEREYCLSFTHEEIVMDLLGKYNLSYKDLPIKIYQFSTKFRNELRAKSGILRGREFLMKDLYSAHVSLEDLEVYFAQVREAYLKIFTRMDLETRVVNASGGVFTEHFTQEFQVECDAGEDMVLFCEKCDFAANVEVIKSNNCPECSGLLKEVKTVEVGHIFTLGTKYAANMNVNFTDETGNKKPLWFASYGIGVSRLLGVLVEKFHDERGIIWPESVAPFKTHLIGLDLENEEIKAQAEKVYQLLSADGMEVLYDDRVGLSAGEKFSDADLIGVPYRLVVSKRTHDQIEVKKRADKNTNFMSVTELLEQIR